MPYIYPKRIKTIKIMKIRGKYIIIIIYYKIPIKMTVSFVTRNECHNTRHCRHCKNRFVACSIINICEVDALN